METVIIGTKNRHKRQKLEEIVSGFLLPRSADSWPEPDETEASFLKIAEAKAAYYSRLGGGLAIATDAGAVFPGLKGWDPLKTKRFAEGDDAARIAALLEIMKDAPDRTVEWHEALALARDGEVIFSSEARAMDGRIAEAFNPAWYREGIWLCSVTEFPELGGRNYFELTPEEQAATEDSWDKLAKGFRRFAENNLQ